MSTEQAIKKIMFIRCAHADDGQPIWSCHRCGALVHHEDRPRHRGWHGLLDELFDRGPS